MKNKGLFIGLGVAAVAAAAFVGKKIISDAKQLQFGLSKYFKLSNIKLLTSDLSVGIKVTNPGSNVVSATNLTAVGEVLYMGKAIVSINQTQSLSLQPGEEKVITVGTRINHIGALRAIMAIIIQGKADTKLDLKGNINYSGFNVPVNQTLNLIKEGGLSGIGAVAGNLNSVLVKFSNPQYNYITSVSASATEASCKSYFVGKLFDLGRYPKEDFQKCIAIEFNPKGIGSVKNLEIEVLRKENIKKPRATNGRYAVIVKNSKWKNYSLEYWTPDMITKKIIPSTENTNSIYVELL